jgi:hypothetical protein
MLPPHLRENVMERDAISPNPSTLEVVPPVAWETTRTLAFVGLGLCGTAAVLGLVAYGLGSDSPWLIDTARLALVFAGALTTGLAISFRPERWQVWALGSVTASLGLEGLPGHWDSFRFLFGILAAVAAFRMLYVLLPRTWRLRVISAIILFHFGGILMATTAPAPTPWFVEQVYHRVYNQYLQFAYLRNAYHFYSPEPGPASILACLIQTEVGEETTPTGQKRIKYETKWVVLPKRPADVRDPLGLTYYRRLSLTEQVSRAIPHLMLPEMFEKHEVRDRRLRLTLNGSDPYYPMHPAIADALEYRLPTPDITRYVLPSYAQHLIIENTPDANTAAKTKVKVYRIEHRTLGVGEFVGFANPDGKPMDPYHPTTYSPYFVGEFDAKGNLIDPQEPMLYWLLPILPRDGGASPTDPNQKDYEDYMSKHAGHEFDWSQLR